MTLPEYLTRIGPKARDVFPWASKGTLKAWRLGYRKPSTEAAKRIIEATGGAIGWDEIYSAEPEKAA